jgi:D-aspartate ligase
MTQPPVVVLGTGITALGVLRILARDKIVAFPTDASELLIRASRYFRRLPGEHPRNEDRELEEWLPKLGLPRAVLMPCSDHWVSRVARLDPALRSRFPASVSCADTIHRFVDKGSFAATLAAAGTPHPFSRELDHVDDLADVPAEVFTNAMLKPRDSQRFIQRFGVKAFHVSSRQEAEKGWRKLAVEGFPVILQEYIPGPATQHYFIDGFVDRGGVVRAMFARRRLRMYPLDFGNSTYMESVTPAAAEGAIESISALLAHVRYRGMFSAEFKLDPRDGQFKLLEVNVRAWWYVDFAARCGVDVCRMAYLDALDRPVADVHHYHVGRTLVYPYADYFACRALLARGELTIWQWLRSWISSSQPIYQWRDPIPSLRAALKFGVGYAARRLRFVRRGVGAVWVSD